ncbi:MAG: hypothetical protein NC548_41575 [Lachnospiraceae bacterium]|nr:hypothetical protein [Lachnospiraceae bacterium]MCM1235787.1 hypothetical protein [Ruminococcus flavefaciens]
MRKMLYAVLVMICLITACMLCLSACGSFEAEQTDIIQNMEAQGMTAEAEKQTVTKSADLIWLESREQ